MNEEKQVPTAGPVERALERLYERHRPWYPLGCLAAVWAWELVVAAPILLFFPARYEGLSVEQFLVAFGVAVGLGAVILALTATLVRDGIRTVLTWTRTGSEEHARAAHQWVFAGPRLAATRAGLLGALSTPAIVATLTVHHDSALDWVELTVGALGAILLALLQGWFMLEVLLRPVRMRLGPRPSPRAHPTGVTAKLALVLPVTWVGGAAVGYLTTTQASEGAGHLLLVYGISLAVTFLAVTVLGPLSSTVLGPVRELTHATKRVAGGSLDAHVSVTTDDELGELAISFNQMLEELRASRERVVAASDAARRKVERDLHDGAQQRLVLLRLKLGLLEREPDRSELVREIQRDLEDAMAELRDLARGLYPPLLESDGLPGALREAANRAVIPTVLDCDGTGRYPPELEAAVYFCCVEALQNAGKHAGEQARATIRLYQADGALRFEIADTGAGFRPVANGIGTGLQNMTDRIGALGGTLRVDSQIGQGTTVAGTVPMESS